MSDAVLRGDPDVPLLVRRSPRARRITLRVSSLDGRVTLTLPAKGSARAALDFARSREDWIRARLSSQPTAAVPVVGDIMEVDGRPRLIVALGRRGARLLADEIVIPRGAPPAPHVAACLKLAARDRLASSVERYAGALERTPGRLTLRDTRSRWGSCSSAGDLMFSWRLILAPPRVLDYVAAHEVAHLERMDHSPAFWSVVERLMPGHAAPRAWLRANGAKLHRWRFGGG